MNVLFRKSQKMYKKSTKTHKQIRNVTEYRINLQNQLYLYILAMKTL